jgi:hypothetical protein
MRPAGHAALVTVGMAIAGPVAGGALGRLLLADTVFAEAVAFFALPLVFGFGYKIWLARVASAAMKGLFAGLLRALWRILIKRERLDTVDVLPTRERLAAMVREALAAASAFTRVGWAWGLANGALAGVAAADGGFVAAFVAYFVLSVAYGTALTRLARAGYIAIPEDF